MQPSEIGMHSQRIGMQSSEIQSGGRTDRLADGEVVASDHRGEEGSEAEAGEDGFGGVVRAGGADDHAVPRCAQLLERVVGAGERPGGGE